MSDLLIKTLAQLEQWRSEPWPRNVYIFGQEGEIYARWTPRFEHDGEALAACFTLANVTVYEKHRGRGLFRAILAACVATQVPRIRLECILNPELARFACDVVYEGRETDVSGHRAPTVEWVLDGVGGESKPHG